MPPHIFARREHRRSTNEPFPFMSLPVELRLMVYELLPEETVVTFRPEIPAKPSIWWAKWYASVPYWTLLEHTCSNSILLVCKQMYIESRGILLQELRKRYSYADPAYRVTSYRYPLLELMRQINLIRYKDALTHNPIRTIHSPVRGDIRNRQSLHGIDPMLLSRLHHRRQIFGSNHSIQIDLEPGHPQTFDDLAYLVQDLVLSNYLATNDNPALVIRVIKEGHFVPHANLLYLVQQASLGNVPTWNLWSNQLIHARWREGDLIIHPRFLSYWHEWAPVSRFEGHYSKLPDNRHPILFPLWLRIRSLVRSHQSPFIFP